MKRIFCLLFLLTLLSAHGFGLGYEGVKPGLRAQINCGHPLARGLVGCWLMNEGSGNKVYDLSGNGYTGSISNAVWQSSKFGHGLSFDGTGDYIDLGVIPQTQGVSQLSISCWIAAAGSTGHAYEAIFGREPDTANRTAVTQSDTGYGGPDELLVFLGNGTNSFGYTTNADVMAANKWVHIAVVFDGTQSGNENRLKIYIDGQQKALGFYLTIPATMSSMQAPVRWGRFGTGTDYDWTGKIDHGLLYNHALTASEVLQLYMTPFRMFEREPIELWTPAFAGAADLEIYVYDTE